jgi:hypothetical protein
MPRPAISAANAVGQRKSILGHVRKMIFAGIAMLSLLRTSVMLQSFLLGKVFVALESCRSEKLNIVFPL